MMNRFEEELELKNDTQRALITDKVIKRKVLAYCRKQFTLDKLTECKKMFSHYIIKYGDKQPVKTSYFWLDKAANYALSYSHIIRTNQPYAKRVESIIEEVEKKKDKTREPLLVFEALKQIKMIGNEMAEKKITGDVRKSIITTLQKFKLENDSLFELNPGSAYGQEPDASNRPKKVDIADIISFIDVIDDKTRIDSPKFQPY